MVRNLFPDDAPFPTPDRAHADAIRPMNSEPAEPANYGHVTADFNAGTLVSGQSTFSIDAPQLAPNDQAYAAHSLSQTWMISGTTRFVCPPTSLVGITQTVEVGWWVQTRPATPTLFVVATADGYCHWSLNGSGTGAPVFVPTNKLYALGMTLPASVLGGVQHEMYAQTAHYGTGWTVTIAIDGVSDQLGYFPSSDFSGTFTSAGDVFQLGGEVVSPSENFWQAEIGSGYYTFFDPSYGDEAYHRDYSVLQAFGRLRRTFTVPDEWRDTRPSNYAYSTSGTPGAGWNHWFFYYDLPKLVPL